MVTKTRTLWLPIGQWSAYNNGGLAASRKWSIPLEQTRTGTSNPLWRTQVKHFNSATTGMTGYVETYSQRGGQAYYSLPRGWNVPKEPWLITLNENCSGFFAALPTGWSHSNGSTTAADNQALMRAYQAVRAQRTHFQSMVFLGELGESLKTLSTVMTKIAGMIPRNLASHQKLIRKYLGPYALGRNGRIADSRALRDRLHKIQQTTPQKWREFRKGLSDNWLEFSFGVRPLVKDVHDIAETIARIQYDTRHSVVRGYGNALTPISHTAGAEAIDGMHLAASSDTVRYFDVTVVYRVGMVFGTSSPAFGSAARVQELSGFNFESFVPSIWNLLPFSWLVDYVVNVGDILTAITTDTSNIAWVNKSVVNVQRKRYAVSCNGPQPGVGGSGGGELGVAIRETRSVTRTSTTLGIPTVQFTMPGAGSLQWLNVAALLSGGSGSRRGF